MHAVQLHEYIKVSQNGNRAMSVHHTELGFQALTDCNEPKDIQDLQVSKVPDPTPNAEEYLIEIRACGANFFDLLQTRGKYQNVRASLRQL